MAAVGPGPGGRRRRGAPTNILAQLRHGQLSGRGLTRGAQVPCGGLGVGGRLRDRGPRGAGGALCRAPGLPRGPALRPCWEPFLRLLGPLGAPPHPGAGPGGGGAGAGVGAGRLRALSPSSVFVGKGRRAEPCWAGGFLRGKQLFPEPQPNAPSDEGVFLRSGAASWFWASEGPSSVRVVFRENVPGLLKIVILLS